MVDYYIHCSDPVMRESIDRLLAHFGYDAVCRVVENTLDADDGAVDRANVFWADPAPAVQGIPSAQVFDMPVRVGGVLDALDAVLTARAGNKIVAVGPYHMRVAESCLVDGECVVKITDTEKRLLLALAAAEGAALARDDLLQRVWGYRPDLDTHTVETHIYRLRQKIEANPSNPKILLTKGDGYSLARQG